jgi:hypothetical protein
MLFLAREGWEDFPSLVILRWYTPTKIFLLGLCFPVTLCFIRGKWSSQVADEIAQVFGEVLVTHLVKVIASLVIEHDDKTKHFFGVQLDRVLRFFWVASIFSVNVGEIPRSGSQKSFPKCLVVEM